MLLNCDVGEDSWESLGLQGDPTSPSWRRSALDIHWKDWCWSWNSNTLATDAKNRLIWKDPDAWKDWKREEKGMREDEMVEWHHWLNGWVWVGSGSWWWTGRPGVLRFTGSQRVGHDWVTELNWTDQPGELKIGEFELVTKVKRSFPDEVVIELKPERGIGSNWGKEWLKERKVLTGGESVCENTP